MDKFCFLFLQICIRVLFFSLNILKACWGFFWSSVGFGANCVDLSDLIFIFNFCATLTPSRDDVKVQKQSIDPRTPTITFAAHQTLFRFLSNYLWFILEVPPIFLFQTEVFSVLKEPGLFVSVMPNCRGSIRVYMGITACHSGCVQITLTDRRASSSIISLELCLVALHPLHSFLSETQFCPEMTSETVVFSPPSILIIHCAVMTSGDWNPKFITLLSWRKFIDQIIIISICFGSRCVTQNHTGTFCSLSTNYEVWKEESKSFVFLFFACLFFSVPLPVPSWFIFWSGNVQ